MVPAPSATPTPTSTPTPPDAGGPGPSAPGGGCADVTDLRPLPNPNAAQLAVQLNGYAQALELRLYGRGLVLQRTVRLAGAWTPGWNRAPLPADFWQDAANGAYFIQVRAHRDGGRGRARITAAVLLR